MNFYNINYIIKVHWTCFKVWTSLYKYYLQHERPFCIVYTNSSRRREFVYPIQHGRDSRECCKWLKKRLILWVRWRRNFKNKRCLSRENQSYSLCKSTWICITYTDTTTIQLLFILMQSNLLEPQSTLSYWSHGGRGRVSFLHISHGINGISQFVNAHPNGAFCVGTVNYYCSCIVTCSWYRDIFTDNSHSSIWELLTLAMELLTLAMEGSLQRGLSSSVLVLFCVGCKFKIMLESANIVFGNLENTRYIIKHSVGNTGEKLCILFVNQESKTAHWYNRYKVKLRYIINCSYVCHGLFKHSFKRPQSCRH
jgi:hypothetical protein